MAGWGVGGGVEGGAELAGGEGFEGAEAGVEFGGGETTIAVEAAKEISGVAFALATVAFDAARDQVAIGIGTEVSLGNNMVEAAGFQSETAHTVETEAAFSLVNGFAKSGSLQEVCAFEGVSENLGARASGGLGVGRCGGSGSENLRGQAHFHGVAHLAALDETQRAAIEKAADGEPRGGGRETRTASEPSDGEADGGLAFEATVAQEMGVDGAVDDGKGEARDEEVFELLPDQDGVEFGVFH